MEELEEMKEAFDNLTESALQLNEMYKKKSKIIETKDKEIERLNNQLEDLEKLNNANYQSFIETNKIIIELEKWLRNEYSKYNGAIRIANVLDKIKELKGEDK